MSNTTNATGGPGTDYLSGYLSSNWI